ncbi:MAG: hypothetical protein ABRQ25_13105 [Clostridiaceae bacterium]
MSEWDFLWEESLSDEELMDAISCGMTKYDIQEFEGRQRKEKWEELKALRDSGQISKEEFKRRKIDLFS